MQKDNADILGTKTSVIFKNKCVLCGNKYEQSLLPQNASCKNNIHSEVEVSLLKTQNDFYFLFIFNKDYIYQIYGISIRRLFY